MSRPDKGYCLWREIFSDGSTYNDNSKIDFSTVNSITEMVTIIITLWVVSALSISKLQSDASYQCLAYYTMAASLRRMIPTVVRIFPFIETFYKIHDYTFDWCDLYAFWETFLAVIEIESLTLMCVDRYVQAKYAAKGWQMNPNIYCLYGSTATFFAFLYAYPPLHGTVGRYAKDFDCFYCTYDMVLPQGWARYLVAFVFFMKTIKPVIIMCLMLTWAVTLENNARTTNWTQKKLTKAVAVLVFITTVCSIPAALARGTVVMSQLIYDGIVIEFSAYFVMWAMFLHWVSPALGLVGFACCDRRLRFYMTSYINFIYAVEPLIRTQVQQELQPEQQPAERPAEKPEVRPQTVEPVGREKKE